MGKEPLIETMSVAFEILEEASAKNGNRMKVKGMFTAMDEINGNGRVYREVIMDREIARLQSMIAENSVYQEADHPEDGKSRIRNTASMLTKLEKKVVDGRKIYEGDATVLGTAIGKDLQEIIRAGGKVGVSSRGFGSLLKGNWQGKMADIVQEDFNLKTFDFVIGQSTKGAEVTHYTEQMEVINIVDIGPCADCTRMIQEDQTTTKGGSDGMDIKTVEDLRKAYPALCEQLLKEVVDAKEKEVKEAMQKDFDARILKEVEKEKEEVKKAVIEEVKNSEEFQGMIGTLIEIGKLVRPYISESEEEEDKENVAAKVKELTLTTEQLKKENKDLKEKSDQDKKDATAKEALAKKINEASAGKKYERLLVERLLTSCKTIEDVDKKLPEEEAFIQKQVGTPEVKTDGKGKVLDENKQDELDEKRKRERSMAGVDEDVARQKKAAGA